MSDPTPKYKVGDIVRETIGSSPSPILSKIISRRFGYNDFEVGSLIPNLYRQRWHYTVTDAGGRTFENSEDKFVPA